MKKVEFQYDIQALLVWYKKELSESKINGVCFAAHHTIPGLVGSTDPIDIVCPCGEFEG